MKFRIRHIVVVAILALSCVLLILNTHNKIYAINSPLSQGTDGADFSVMTFNIAATDTLAFNEWSQRELLKIVDIENPDILCFQELSFVNLKKIQPKLDSIYGHCEVLKESEMWRLIFYTRLPLRNYSKHKCFGDLETNDLSEEEVSYFNQSQQRMQVMSADFEVVPGKWVKIFSGHLRSSAYSTARRSMDKNASWFDGISLYKRNYDVGKRIRDYEAENVRKFIDEARADRMPVIVAGDLNDWCGSDCLNTLMGDDLKDAWWEGGNGFGWTFSGWHLRLRLDHILYSDELELIDVKVIDSDLSDHKPLMARFRVK